MNIINELNSMTQYPDTQYKQNFKQIINVKQNRPTKSWWDKDCEKATENRKK